MIKTYLKTALLSTIAVLLLSSCEEKLPTEFGESKVYFASTSSIRTFRGIDVANLEQIKADTDTTYNVAAVYRSGIVDNLEEITVQIAIDSAYLDSVIFAAKTSPANLMTDLMSTFKNSRALGAAYFSIPDFVTIPKGKRSAAVPILIKRSGIKLFDNATFNYNTNDLDNPLVPKDKRLVLPIKISSVSNLTILDTHNRYYFQIVKLGDLK